MANTYMIISNVAFILATVFLIVAIVLFFAFKIREVIAFLNGKEAKRNMERIRKEVEDKNVKKSDVKAFDYSEIAQNMKYEKDTEDEEETTLLSDESKTTVLQNEEGTTLLAADDDFVIEKNITYVHSENTIDI